MTMRRLAYHRPFVLTEPIIGPRTMPNPHPSDYYTPAAWLAGREGLSIDPLRRAAQLAMAALDQIIGADVLAVPEAVAAKVAYEALRAALG